MRRELPPVQPEGLYLRRLAARALDLVLQHHGLGEMALRLNPDDPTQVLTADAGEVRFYRDTTITGHRSIARVYLSGTTARVVVEDLRELIRPAHRREFSAAELGLEKGLDVEVDVSGVVEEQGDRLRNAPQRVLARRRGTGERGVIPALSALRRR